jgi:hypothetical protein
MRDIYKSGGESASVESYGGGSDIETHLDADGQDKAYSASSPNASKSESSFAASGVATGDGAGR